MRNVQVNFDPANMVLYGAGDPIDAVNVLDASCAVLTLGGERVESPSSWAVTAAPGRCHRG